MVIIKAGLGHICGTHNVKCIVVEYVKECPVCHERIIVKKLSYKKSVTKQKSKKRKN